MSTAFKVLVCIDTEHVFERLIKVALSLCAQHPSSELHVLSVAELMLPPSTAFVPGAPAPDYTQNVEQKRLVEVTTAALQAFSAENKSVPARTEVHTLIGQPAREIVWLAAHVNADTIVMATHGRRGLGRVLVGSVAEKVVRLAGCPVLVFREKSHPAAWVIPEIEPVCDECAKVRLATQGAKLWCERHSEHHVRAHVYSSSSLSGEAPHAWSSSTGT